MQKVTFSIPIKASKEKVWKTLLEDATYRKWTSPFTEGSYAETDWKEGSKALFLSPSGEGMVSRIETHRPNDYLSILHLGVVKNGVEDTTSDEVKAWAGAHENYTVKEADGVTTVSIEMDTTDEYKSYFEETWPKALAKLKDVAES